MQTSDTKYDVVCEAPEKRGWICLHDPPEEMDRRQNNDWTVYWTDTSISVERVMKLQLFHKINHFPGMLALCRKTAVARNLNRIRAVFPEEYKFYPQTWILPDELLGFQAQFTDKKNKRSL
jgi:tubulin polyglutamylase TTLL6/13